MIGEPMHMASKEGMVGLIFLSEHVLQLSISPNYLAYSCLDISLLG